MIAKVLVNRGEIAIRAFRTTYEFGIATVAVYAYEDGNSPHRVADDLERFSARFGAGATTALGRQED
jgi:pyruvate carboxylase